MPRRAARTKVIPLAGILLLAAGCASSGPSGSTPGPEPILSVESFLQAANTRDFERMARLFGTDQGAVLDRTGSPIGCAFRRVGSWVRLSDRCASWQDIEVRMSTLAMILEHDDYRIRTEDPVAGRRSPTRRVTVDLERDGEAYPQVPFVVVRAGEGRWLVEEIGIDRITGSRE